jgi:hypothetical protein
MVVRRREFLGAIVASWDLNTGPAPLVACQYRFSGLERLEGNAVFHLSDLSSEPLWAVDGDAPETRVVFIPSLTRQAEGLPHGGAR